MSETVTRPDCEEAAVWQRSHYLGTDYPAIAWQDASESEREAWTRVAHLLLVVRAARDELLSNNDTAADAVLRTGGEMYP